MERIPILRMGTCLLVTIQVDMHDQLAMTLQNDLAHAVAAQASTGLLIDISALEMVDSFIGRMIANTAAIGRILDVDTVVVGMRPAVAITLVELGLSLPGVHTALNVERGMALLDRATVARCPKHSWSFASACSPSTPTRTSSRRAWAYATGRARSDCRCST